MLCRYKTEQWWASCTTFLLPFCTREGKQKSPFPFGSEPNGLPLSKCNPVVCPPKPHPWTSAPLWSIKAECYWEQEQLVLQQSLLSYMTSIWGMCSLSPRDRLFPLTNIQSITNIQCLTHDHYDHEPPSSLQNVGAIVPQSPSCALIAGWKTTRSWTEAHQTQNSSLQGCS